MAELGVAAAAGDASTAALPKGPLVLVVARKVLLRNTRIFKQSKSLVDSGCEVVVVGIRPVGAPEAEERDGFRIVRLQLDPLYASAPRRVRLWLRGWELRLRPLPRDFRHARLLGKVTVRLRLVASRLIGRVNGPLTGALRWALVKLTMVLRSIDFYGRVDDWVTASGLQPDVIHANDLDAMWIAWRLARRYKVPLVYDAQELYTGQHTLPRWYRWLTGAQEFFLIRRADRVVVVNNAIADVMAHRYRRPIDAVVLNCAPYEELTEVEGGGRDIRGELGLDHELPVFLYSGALTPKRGLENLVVAMTMVPRGALVVLGEGPLRPRLDELIAQHELAGRVAFIDFVPHHDVPSVISAADVGVVPYENVGTNHYLCSPSKLFHYIMAGLPIACSAFPFLELVVARNGLGATFDPASPASMAAALRSMVDDPVEYAAMRERLLQARQRYCWEVEAERFLGIYAGLGIPVRAAA